MAMMVGVGALGPIAQAGATTTESDESVLVDVDETTSANEANEAPVADEVEAPSEDESATEPQPVAEDSTEEADETAADEAVEDEVVEDEVVEVSAEAETEVVTQHEAGGTEETEESASDEDGSGTAGIIDGWLEGLDSGAGRCDGDQTYALAEIFLAQGYNRRFIMQGDVRVVDLTTQMEAGEYVVDTYSWDEHPNRPYDTPQASERYYVEFVDAEGNVVGSTGATTDLPDDVVRGESYDTFEVTLTGTAVEMRIIHIQDYITTGSVVPGCLSISAVVEPEPETPPTTTPPTTTPPTTAPPVTTPPATTPPTTEAPTTTAPAVEVDDNTATLPHTGSNALGLTMVGGSLIVTGLGFTLISRRRLGALS